MHFLPDILQTSSRSPVLVVEFPFTFVNCLALCFRGLRMSSGHGTTAVHHHFLFSDVNFIYSLNQNLSNFEISEKFFREFFSLKKENS